MKEKTSWNLKSIVKILVFMLVCFSIGAYLAYRKTLNEPFYSGARESKEGIKLPPIPYSPFHEYSGEDSFSIRFYNDISGLDNYFFAGKANDIEFAVWNWSDECILIFYHDYDHWTIPDTFETHNTFNAVQRIDINNDGFKDLKISTLVESGIQDSVILYFDTARKRFNTNR